MSALAIFLSSLSVFLVVTGAISSFKGALSNKGLFAHIRGQAWWISSLSLMSLSISLDQIQVSAELIQSHGPAGLWILWISLITAFVVPYAFGNLWAKLGLPTDNHFIRLRYAGRGASVLFWFRTIYLGSVIVPIFIAFHGIAALQLLTQILDITAFQGVCCIATILILTTWKNNLRIKIPIDGWYTIIFTAVLVYLGIDLYQNEGGDEPILTRAILPWTGDSPKLHLMISIFAFQWWSAQLFDGSGTEMARITSVENQKRIVLSGMLSAVHRVFIYLIVSWIALLLVRAGEHNDQGLYNTLLHGQPEWSKGFFLFVFVLMFISQAESLMNWGGGLLSDAYVHHIMKEPKQVDYPWRVGATSMLWIAAMAIAIMLMFDRIEHLLGYFLSISAGVAPLFIARWFWQRISAWSQLAAMLGSAVFTIAYPLIDAWVEGMTAFRFEDRRLIFVTLATSTFWIVVTIFIPEKKTSPILSLQEKLHVMRRLMVAILLGVLLMALLLGGLLLWTH